MRSRAAVEWAGPSAALSGLAGLAAFRYAPVPVDTIQVVVAAGRHRQGPAWIKVRSLTMPFATATWSPVTQMTLPNLSLVLGYGAVPARHRASFVHGAVRAGIVNAEAALALTKSLTRIPSKRELVDRLTLIAAGAESYLEERGMSTIFSGDEFADIVLQHRVRVRGEAFRIDAFHPASMTAFELDGDGTHDEPRHRKRDIRRDALLGTIGIATVRLSREAVLENPEWCRGIVRETIDARTNRWWAA